MPIQSRPCFIVAGLLALRFADCGGAGAVTSAASTIIARPEVVHGSGQVPRVDLVVNGFKVRGHPLDDSFGYYVYLYFAAPDLAPTSQRAAADAFMSLFSNAAQVGGQRKHLALAVAPIKTDTLPTSGQRLIADYDYDHSQLVVRTLNDSSLPPVALIGIERPLNPANPPKDVLVLNLCGDANQVRARILRLRDQLLTAPKPQLASVNISTSLRNFLGNIGAKFLSLIAVESAQAAENCP